MVRPAWASASGWESRGNEATPTVEPAGFSRANAFFAVGAGLVGLSARILVKGFCSTPW